MHVIELQKLNKFIIILCAVFLFSTNCKRWFISVQINYATLLWTNSAIGSPSDGYIWDIADNGWLLLHNNFGNNYRGLAYWAIASQDDKEAIFNLNNVLLDNPEQCVIRFHLGNLLLQNGERLMAIKILQTGYCQIENYYLLQAEIAARLQDWQQAEQLYELVLDIDPDSYEGLLELAKLTRMGFQPERALELLLHAVAVEPNRREAYVEIGQVYELSLRQYEAALGWYMAALERFPQQANLHRYPARIYMQQGNYDEALAHLHMAPHNSYNKFLFAEIYRRKGDLQSAIYYYKIVVDQRPEVYAWQITLADLLLLDEQYCAVIELYARAYANKPSLTEQKQIAEEKLNQLGGFCDQ